MKSLQKILIVLLSLCLLTPAALAGKPPHSETSPFQDIQGHWAKSAIEYLQNREVVQGKSEGIFAPDDLVTRAEMTKIAMVLFYGGEIDFTKESGQDRFEDVVPGDWFYNYVTLSNEAGFVQGEGDHFYPHRSVTKAEGLKILLETAGIGADLDIDVGYKDVKEEDWFYNYVNYAFAQGIVGGLLKPEIDHDFETFAKAAAFYSENGYDERETGLFDPHEHMTRADVATMARLAHKAANDDNSKLHNRIYKDAELDFLVLPDLGFGHLFKMTFPESWQDYDYIRLNYDLKENYFQRYFFGFMWQDQFYKLFEVSIHLKAQWEALKEGLEDLPTPFYETDKYVFAHKKVDRYPEAYPERYSELDQIFETLQGQPWDEHRCNTAEAESLYSQLFFLEPLTKEEMETLVKENNLDVTYMLLAKEKEDELHNVFELYPHLTPNSLNNSLKENLELDTTYFGPDSNFWESRVADREQEIEQYSSLIEAYDANEPVVWTLETEGKSLKEISQLAYELDIEQSRLGIYEEELNHYSGYMPEYLSPEFIRPKREGRDIIQAKCYEYLE